MSTGSDADDNKQGKEQLPHDAEERWSQVNGQTSNDRLGPRQSLCLCGSKPLYKKDLIICAHTQHIAGAQMRQWVVVMVG